MITLKDIETLAFDEDAFEALKELVEDFKNIHSHNYTIYEEKSAKKRTKEDYKEFKKSFDNGLEKKAEFEKEEAEHNRPYTMTEAYSLQLMVEDIIGEKVKVVKFGRRSLDIEVELSSDIKERMKTLDRFIHESEGLVRGASYKGKILHFTK
jgi:hypothetical protein